MKGKCNGFHVLSIGIAFGIVWALGVVLLGLGAWWFGWGDPIVELLSSIYRGYDESVLGVLIGGLWGFVDAFIAGVIFAWIYNCLIRCCGGRCEIGKEK